MSTRQLRSIWRSRRRMSHGVRSRASARSAARATSATTVTPGMRRSCDLRPWRKSAWSSAITMRSGVSTSGLPENDVEVSAGHSRRADMHLPAELRDVRGDRPWCLRGIVEPHAVVLQHDAHLAVHAPRLDHRGAREGMMPDVARALEHDAQDMLDEGARSVEVSAHAHPGLELVRHGRRRLALGELPDVGAQPVVLPREARLQLGQGCESLVAPPATHELLTAAERQVGPREHLDAAVVERAGDLAALARPLEAGELGLERQALAAEVRDEVADDGEVERPEHE